MTSDPVVQWAVTGLFGVLGGHALWRLVTARKTPVAVGYLCHLGMNLGMVAMVWPWWAWLPTLPQLVFFAAAAAFFAASAGWSAADAVAGGPAGGQVPVSRRRVALVQAVHALMMLAMVWAVAVMSRAHPGAARHVDHGVGSDGLGAWTTVGGAALAAALVAGGALFLVYLVRRARERGSLGGRVGIDHLASALASFGMAAMCGLMLL